MKRKVRLLISKLIIKNLRLKKFFDPILYINGPEKLPPPLSAEEEKASKLILERIVPFETVQRQLWVQFVDLEEYQRQEKELFRLLMDSEGDDEVVVYVRREKMKKVLPASRNIRISPELLERLYGIFGEKNVKAVEKRIENRAQMN